MDLVDDIVDEIFAPVDTSGGSKPAKPKRRPRKRKRKRKPKADEGETAQKRRMVLRMVRGGVDTLRSTNNKLEKAKKLVAEATRLETRAAEKRTAAQELSESKNGDKFGKAMGRLQDIAKISWEEILSLVEGQLTSKRGQKNLDYLKQLHTTMLDAQPQDGDGDSDGASTKSPKSEEDEEDNDSDSEEDEEGNDSDSDSDSDEEGNKEDEENAIREVVDWMCSTEYVGECPVFRGTITTSMMKKIVEQARRPLQRRIPIRCVTDEVRRTYLFSASEFDEYINPKEVDNPGNN